MLVFGRTGSASWSALTYALTFLPALVGGVALGGLADRFRRRQVMVAADLLRAGLVAVMAVPGLSLWALSAVLAVVVLLAAPHTAALGALLPQVLAGRLYERGLAVRQITAQCAQLVGFSAGGVLVATLGPAPALLADAATFAVSALLVRVGVAARDRPSGAGRGTDRAGTGGVVAVVREIAADPARRALVLLAWLVGCYVVPEGLAAPYAAEIGAGAGAVGLLLAADPLGSVLGAWLFVRFVPPGARARLVGVLAVAAGVPLLLFLLRPGVPVAVLLLAASGRRRAPTCCRPRPASSGRPRTATAAAPSASPRPASSPARAWPCWAAGCSPTCGAPRRPSRPVGRWVGCSRSAARCCGTAPAARGRRPRPRPSPTVESSPVLVAHGASFPERAGVQWWRSPVLVAHVELLSGLPEVHWGRSQPVVRVMARAAPARPRSGHRPGRMHSCTARRRGGNAVRSQLPDERRKAGRPRQELRRGCGSTGGKRSSMRTTSNSSGGRRACPRHDSPTGGQRIGWPSSPPGVTTGDTGVPVG